MWKLIFILVALPAFLNAQVTFHCAITPKNHSKMIFGKRTARDIRIWTCVARNDGSEAVVVSRATILHGLLDAGVNGYSSEAVRIFFTENQRLGRPKTLGRIISQAVGVGALVVGSGIMDVNVTWRTGLVVGGQVLGPIAGAISARAPTLENFERLNEMGPFGVDPHSDLEVVMFSGPWDGEDVVAGVLRGPPIPISMPVPERLKFEKVTWPTLEWPLRNLQL